jgi:YHS domain-containing protein
VNTQASVTKSYFDRVVAILPTKPRCRSRWFRGLSQGLLTGALMLATPAFTQAQAPVLRGGENGRPVMQFNTLPNSVAESDADRPTLQPAQQPPELMQIGREAQGTLPLQQPAQQAFNIQPPSAQGSQSVQLVAERRNFFDLLMPWRRRDNVPQEYEQPVEPPNQYQSNPLPANAATDYGPAMSGFNQRYNRPTTHPGAAPPRTAQGGRPAANPPTLRPPATPPAAPPQSAGTTTTNDGRELPVFQFGAGPRSTGTPLTPPPAPRPQPSAAPTTPPTSESGEAPSVTPATPMPPILPLRSPSSIVPPVSESSSTRQIDPPTFEDPVVSPEAVETAPMLLPGGNASNSTAFPPPPSGTGAVQQPPLLNPPLQEQTTPPTFVPPGAPSIDTPSTGPQLMAIPPAFTTPVESNDSPYFAANTGADESEEDKFARIRERRGQTGLKGFCPVMLRDHRELVDASPEFQIEYNGHTYHVSSLEALQAFEADPAKYAPAQGGCDVIHRDLTGEELPGSLDHAVWYRGRLYMFATAETMETFVAAPAAHRSDI